VRLSGNAVTHRQQRLPGNVLRPDFPQGGGIFPHNQRSRVGKDGGRGGGVRSAVVAALDGSDGVVRVLALAHAAALLDLIGSERWPHPSIHVIRGVRT